MMKLLIVDDNSALRSVMKKICSGLFAKIIECEDGDEAIQITVEEKPDWILMDFKMERMDGITATEKIIAVNPLVKIIVVSQYNENDTINASIECGAVEFVGKENLTKVIEIISNHN